MDKPILSVSALQVKYNNHYILEDINLKVNQGETLAIIGPNGAGKTVFFRAILGLIPYQGKVEWQEAKIGYVPQKFYIPHDIPLTVEEFLGFKEKDMGKVYAALEGVGFTEANVHAEHLGKKLLKSKMGVLSGGELQRVLIAFAVLGNPNVLLFDEPTSGIDVSGEESVYALISRLQKQKALTIIFISHEIDVIHKYADNVLCLNKRGVCYGPPSHAINPESLKAMYGEDIHIHRHTY